MNFETRTNPDGSRLKLVFENWPNHRRGGIARDTSFIREQLLISDRFELHQDSRFSHLFNLKILSRIQTFLGGLGIRFRFRLRNVDVTFIPQVSSFVRTSKTGAQIVRIHDIFPITHPEWFRFFPRKNFERALNSATQSETTVFLCNSEETKTNLLGHFSDVPLKALVYPCQPRKFEAFMCRKCSACQSNYTPSNGFFLMVGTIEPRKDYDFILRVLDKPNSHNLQIFVVGRPGWKCKRLLNELRRNIQITWYEDCCDGALQNLYLNATAYISTSFDEGFNLPASEARLYGTPLLLRDIGIHREIHKEYASFFRSESELLELIYFQISRGKVRTSMPEQEIVGFPSDSIIKLLNTSSVN